MKLLSLMKNWIRKNNVNIIIVVACFFYSHNHLQAQLKDSTYQLLREKYLADSIKICKPEIIRPQLGLDNRKSFIRNSPVDINGYFAGILYKRHYRFTIGYYQVENQSKVNKRVLNHQVVNVRDLELYYTTFNFEWFVLNRRYLRLGFPVDLGFGFSNLSIYNENKTKLLYHTSGNFTPISLGTELTIKPLRWFGISGLFGYRKILRNTEENIDFNGLFYSYGLTADIKEIIKDFKLYRLKKRYKKALRLK